MRQIWPQLVPFSFWAVSRADRDRKLQWLTRTIRLDDIDWQLIIDLLGTEADPPNSNMTAAEILDRLDVGASAAVPPAQWTAMTRCRFAEAGYSALATPSGAVWAVRVDQYRIEIADATGNLGTNPWDTYFVSVCPFDAPDPVVTVEADDQDEALELGAEARADPEAFIDKHTHHPQPVAA